MQPATLGLTIALGVAALLFLYTWFGYPLLILVLAAISGKGRSLPKTAGYEPSVSVIIPVYNAGKKIVAKLESITRLDYPADKMEIIVVSDGSTDDTVSLARDSNLENLHILELEENRGKSEAQNRAAASARNEILVMTDVDSRLDPHFVRNVVRHFDDPHISCVGGRALQRRNDGELSQSQGIYLNLEQNLKKAESNLGMLHSVAGWGFAIRKADWMRLDEDTGDDLILPLELALSRKRTVLAPDAVVTDDFPSSIKGELRARQRITMRNFTGLMRRHQLLNPFLYPRMAFALWSHKIIRWLSPVTMIVILLTNVALAILSPSSIFLYLLLVQVGVYAIALLGVLLTRAGLSLPIISQFSSFLLGNYGLLLGVLRALAKQKVTSYSNE